MYNIRPPMTPYRNNMVPQQTYKTQEEALKLVKQSVRGEREDELFYDYLLSEAPTEEEKEIITSIRNDERKHNQMYRRIYQDLTGEIITTPTDVTFEKPASYLDGIKKAFFGELSAMERYRIIRAGMPNQYYRDMVFEILTDELKHADKYNYILNLNAAKGSYNPPNTPPNIPPTSTYTPDQWIEYITPLVNRALAEYKEGINIEHLFQEFILSGVLVGLGSTPQEAIEQVEKWEKTGESKLLIESKKKGSM